LIRPAAVGWGRRDFGRRGRGGGDRPESATTAGFASAGNARMVTGNLKGLTAIDKFLDELPPEEPCAAPVASAAAYPHEGTSRPRAQSPAP